MTERKKRYSRSRAVKLTPRQVAKVDEVRKINAFESWSHALRFMIDCHGELGRSPRGARA